MHHKRLHFSTTKHNRSSTTQHYRRKENDDTVWGTERWTQGKLHFCTNSHPPHRKVGLMLVTLITHPNVLRWDNVDIFYSINLSCHQNQMFSPHQMWPLWTDERFGFIFQRFIITWLIRLGKPIEITAAWAGPGPILTHRCTFHALVKASSILPRLHMF